MANVPLSSLKFPGLDDVYTIPQVDDTLSVQGGAADALRTGNRIKVLEEHPSRRVTPISDVIFSNAAVVDVVGIPPHLDADDFPQYPAYNLTEPGWYAFASVSAKPGTTVTANTTVTGAAGYVATVGEDHVNLAIRFEVASTSQKVTINWGDYTDVIIFQATDLAIRNLDYRVTFYVYDAAPFVTFEYALTTDTTFVADKSYFTKDGDNYVKAEVTVGDAVTENTYYNHTKCTISGLARNITYKLDEIIDCPMEFILPEIEDETHGCWFEIRLQHAGEYSMTLTPPSADVKIATEHTQKETKGLNMVDLHYTAINGVKLWRFMNTHSTIPD